MQLSIDPDELRPIISAAVAEVLAQIRADESAVGDKLAVDEREAARLLDIEHHVLRDARLRGEISASRIAGRRIRYAREDLVQYLARHRTEART